jgi:hypothetical protein
MRGWEFVFDCPKSCASGASGGRFAGNNGVLGASIRMLARTFFAKSQCLRARIQSIHPSGACGRARISRYRRHSKDYERNPETSETMIDIAMIHLMSRRLAKQIGV